MVQFEYDDAGNVSAQIDENGNRTEYLYDPFNRVLTTTEADPDGAGPLTSPVTQMTYDAAGNLATMIDSRSNTLLYEYDERDRMTRQVDPNGDDTRLAYDGNGNPFR
jgi:YD repeat-containing protein